MKKFTAFLLLTVTLMSCSLDNNNSDIYLQEFLSIESYTVPTVFILGKTYEIKLKYQKPTFCHTFQGIYLNTESNIKTISIKTSVKNNQNCTEVLPPISEVSFDFIATNSGPYTFKFYKGRDFNGLNLFEEVEIPVTN